MPPRRGKEGIPGGVVVGEAPPQFHGEQEPGIFRHMAQPGPAVHADQQSPRRSAVIFMVVSFMAGVGAGSMTVFASTV